MKYVLILASLIAFASCRPKKEYTCTCRWVSSGQVMQEITIEARDYDEASEVCKRKENAIADCDLY